MLFKRVWRGFQCQVRWNKHIYSPMSLLLNATKSPGQNTCSSYLRTFKSKGSQTDWGRKPEFRTLSNQQCISHLFPLWSLLTWTQREFKDQNYAARKNKKTPQKTTARYDTFSAFWHKEWKRDPVDQKSGGSPLCLFLLPISFSHIPIPGIPEAVVVMVTATVGWAPRIPTRGTEVLKPWEKFSLYFFIS